MPLAQCLMQQPCDRTSTNPHLKRPDTTWRRSSGETVCGLNACSCERRDPGKPAGVAGVSRVVVRCGYRFAEPVFVQLAPVSSTVSVIDPGCDGGS